ncbi:MAG: DHH family phosphoesterase [Christensenellales bacterium]|jgi:phosphoesterase RecJ-like protein
MNIGTYQDVLAHIREARTILLTTHRKADGDAMGSMLALYLYLTAIGKTVRMVVQDAVQDNLCFLPEAQQVLRAQGLTGQPDDLALSVDASDMELLGDAAEPFFAAGFTIQIDHHRTNTHFAQLNVVKDTASSAGVMVYELLEAAGATITQDIATCLYTAMSTDTGNFCFGNLDDQVFEYMAVLMRAGLPIVQTARQLHLMRSREQVMLLGRALNSLQFLEDGRLTMMQLTAQDFAECVASCEHTERIVNYALNLPGVEMCFLVSELHDGIKFGLRSIAPHDVSLVAKHFGGGGHALAAGCTMQGILQDCVDIMKNALTRLLNGQWHL